jgi:hypothetical protein
MSTALGYGISREASNQYSCDNCGGYYACVWAKKFGRCTCPDIGERWRQMCREMGDPKDIHFNSHGRRRISLMAGIAWHNKDLAERRAAKAKNNSLAGAACVATRN